MRLRVTVDDDHGRPCEAWEPPVGDGRIIGGVPHVRRGALFPKYRSSGNTGHNCVTHTTRAGRRSALSVCWGGGWWNGARTSWRQDIAQIGVIFDVGVHLPDLIQWVSGQRFVEVSAFTHPDRRRGEPDDTVTVLGRLEGDCHAVVRATREVASAENNLIIEDPEATLITSALRFAIEHVVRVRDRVGPTEERFPASPAYELEVRAFESELRGERSRLPDGEESVQTVAVTQAVLQAIDERRSVAVPVIGTSPAGDT